MKKWIMSSCMGAVLALSIGAVAMAQGQSPSQFCKANGDFGVSHAMCVNCVVDELNGGATIPVCICKQLEEEANEAGQSFPLGECISSFIAVLNRTGL